LGPLLGRSPAFSRENLPLLFFHSLQIFFQEFCQWSENLQAHISNGGLAQDAIEAERLTEHHNDLKAQIQGREQLLGHLVQKSRGLSLDVIDAKDPANEAETRLKDTWNQLNAAWDQRNVMLRQCNDQQVRPNRIFDILKLFFVEKNVHFDVFHSGFQ
jgi:hypothetical protein